MVAGYVRLSRDDDQRNYSSIENQKRIICQFAAEQGLTVDCWYEDDGFSGYSFDRPGFTRLMSDLERKVDTVIAKDFSRIGRHNAKVLLLLEMFRGQDRRLLLVDDSYDTWEDEDDIIGIKTWYNERYVKDTSRKIRKVIRARQKDGTLYTRLPFGYRRSAADPGQLEIVPEEASVVRRVLTLYLLGNTPGSIAALFNREEIPTPSRLLRLREMSEGGAGRRYTASRWAASMVTDILKNDFYSGTLRLHKRERAAIHGADKRVPPEEQLVFPSHHPAIITEEDFRKAQTLRRPSGRHFPSSGDPWSGLLFCGDCGAPLIPIHRGKEKVRHYYICSRYNSMGKSGCSGAHSIAKEQLSAILHAFTGLLQEKLVLEVPPQEEAVNPVSNPSLIPASPPAETDPLRNYQLQLKILLEEKTRDLALAPFFRPQLERAYSNLQAELLEKIRSCEEAQAQGLSLPPLPAVVHSDLSPLLVTQIRVDSQGMPEITLNWSLFSMEPPAAYLNRQHNQAMLHLLKGLSRNIQPYTSARQAVQLLNEAGLEVSRKTITPYLRLLENQKVLQPTGNSRRPYQILPSPQQLQSRIQAYQDLLP